MKPHFSSYKKTRSLVWVLVSQYRSKNKKDISNIKSCVFTHSDRILHILSRLTGVGVYYYWYIYNVSQVVDIFIRETKKWFMYNP